MVFYQTGGVSEGTPILVKDHTFHWFFSGYRLAKCHRFGGLIRVNFLEVWGKFFESVIRVFDVWVILPHALQQLSNFTPLYRVTKCHRNGRYICVKVLEVWGKILGE